VEANLKLLEQELNILLSVDHPYIVKFYEAFLDHKYVHLVMEYCNGGDLSDKLLKIKKFREKDAKKIIMQSLYALKHLHEHKIAHRDFKPENILFTVDDNDVKLIDFGISKMLQQNSQVMREKIGTAWYVAPEVLNKQYDMRCDLWSVGVVTFALLSGSLPFTGQNAAALYKKIREADYNF